MLAKIRYLHFLIAWILCEVLFELTLAFIVNNNKVKIADFYMNLYHCVWLALLPIGTALFFSLFIYRMYCRFFNSQVKFDSRY